MLFSVKIWNRESFEAVFDYLINKPYADSEALQSGSVFDAMSEVMGDSLPKSTRLLSLHPLTALLGPGLFSLCGHGT